MFIPLVFGLSLFGFGEGLLVDSRWGATPWTVFAEGISKHAHISIGWSTAAISAVVLLLWFPLRERPGLGTIANLVIIATFLDLTAAWLPLPTNPAIKCLYIVAAVVVIGIGSALYLTTALGPGPRDGLMTSLHRHFGVSVVYVRLGIEVIVLAVGWSLGGTVGIGTVVFATTIGFSIGLSLNLLSKVLKFVAHD